ncbi:MAG: 2-oxoacid:ferredoxin oxidoreductase subunit beta [Lachnospiraceae bacterium]|jgi:2-oxoglutarate ferredoxin oxidoreductase subunit beta
MSVSNSPFVKKYFRQEMMPHIWCPGCGNGIIMRDIAKAIEKNNLKRDEVVIVSGIGCSGRAAGYMDFNTIHTTHGRAIPVATGIKMARRDLEVIVITGDGDSTAIGGNHFIHAARRNIDLTVVVFNNSIYGMTGGQYSPTTPKGEMGTTAPYGSVDQDFDVCKLAIAAGATFVGRGTVFHTPQTIKLIERGINHKGFSVIDCVSICPTYYGRKNKKGDAVEMMQWIKDNTINHEQAQSMFAEEVKDKIIMGLIYHNVRPEYCSQYQELIERSRKED